MRRADVKVLQPLAQFNARELRDVAVQVNQLVKRRDVAEQLRARHLIGVLARHTGDTAGSIRSLRYAKRAQEEGRLGAYAVVNAAGDIAGMATVMSELVLRRQRMSIPPKIAQALPHISKPVEIHGPDLKVWTHEKESKYGNVRRLLLTDAYTELVEVHAARDYNNYVQLREGLDGTATIDHAAINPWTIEPMERGQKLLSWPLRWAGLYPRENGVFDDQESRKLSPPLSTLYTHTALTPPSIAT